MQFSKACLGQNMGLGATLIACSMARRRGTIASIGSRNVIQRR